MSEYEIEVTDAPAATDVERLGNGLTEHSLAFTVERGFLPVSVSVRDSAGELVGGIAAFHNWNWLQINLVWLRDDLRGTGLGSRMLERVLEEGRARGCGAAHLDTFSYQARPFYERHGFEVFAELEDYPPGHRRFYMKKSPL